MKIRKGTKYTVRRSAVVIGLVTLLMFSATVVTHVLKKVNAAIPIKSTSTIDGVKISIEETNILGDTVSVSVKLTNTTQEKKKLSASFESGTNNSDYSIQLSKNETRVDAFTFKCDTSYPVSFVVYKGNQVFKQDLVQAK